MTRERYDPCDDPEAVPCPAGCGWLTDDPYGGPCWQCWADLTAEGREAHWVPRRCCDEDCSDIYPTARPVVTVHAAGGRL